MRALILEHVSCLSKPYLILNTYVCSFTNLSISMRKLLVILLFFGSTLISLAQSPTPSEIFWENLKKHCGKSYAGSLPEGVTHKDFSGKKLVMHVRACENNRIRIPFFVDNDRSRTWVFTLENGVIKLKHDHRHEDGSEDKITQYGGVASNTGMAELQMFPADQETANLIGYAANNVWWVTLNQEIFSYNLRRTGAPSAFSVLFDLSKPIQAPEAPWGWVD